MSDLARISVQIDSEAMPTRLVHKNVRIYVLTCIIHGTAESYLKTIFTLSMLPRLAFPSTKKQARLIFDTASDIAIISRELWNSFGCQKLEPVSLSAINACGGSVKRAWKLSSDLKYGDSISPQQLTKLTLINLLGLDWIDPYYQHYTATQNRAKPTALVLRASPAGSQLSAKIRGSATGRESGNVGSSLAISATASSSSSWMAYNNGSSQRSINVSDLHSLEQHQASGSTMASSSLSRHSNSPNTATRTLSGASSATVVGRHSTGSNRYIVIGANTMRKKHGQSMPYQGYEFIRKCIVVN
ncbi:hypothetical protein ACTXT7_012236, partial [Hymenolepis weldensis]